MAITSVNKIVTGILLATGTVVFITADTSFYTALTAFGQNMNLLALFLLIPLIGTFMSTAGYLSALKEKVMERETQHGQHPYRLGYLLVSTVGIILNFGTLAIVKRIADESFSSYQKKKLLLHIMRGFAFCMLWSPYFVNVALVIVLFDVSWFDIGGFGLIMAFIYLLISMIMLPKINFPDDPFVEAPGLPAAEKNRSGNFRSLIIFSSVLIALSFLFDYLLAVNMLTVVSTLAVFLPVVWAVCSGLLKPFMHDAYIQIQGSFFKLKNELAVFISAGYFGMALSFTDLGDTVSSAIYTVSSGSVYLFTIIIMLTSVALAQVGIHPIIIVIGIGSALSPEAFGVSHEYLALTLLLSWTMATQLSPFSGQMLMTSQLMNTPPLQIARQNIQFVAICFVVLSAVLFGFHAFGWV